MDKKITVRLSELEVLIMEKLQNEFNFKNGDRDFNNSEMVRFCIKATGQNMLDQEDMDELILHANKFTY